MLTQHEAVKVLVVIWGAIRNKSTGVRLTAKRSCAILRANDKGAGSAWYGTRLPSGCAPACALIVEPMVARQYQFCNDSNRLTVEGAALGLQVQPRAVASPTTGRGKSGQRDKMSHNGWGGEDELWARHGQGPLHTARAYCLGRPHQETMQFFLFYAIFLHNLLSACECIAWPLLLVANCPIGKAYKQAELQRSDCG